LQTDRSLRLLELRDIYRIANFVILVREQREGVFVLRVDADEHRFARHGPSSCLLEDGYPATLQQRSNPQTFIGIMDAAEKAHRSIRKPRDDADYTPIQPRDCLRNGHLRSRNGGTVELRSNPCRRISRCRRSTK